MPMKIVPAIMFAECRLDGVTSDQPCLGNDFVAPHGEWQMVRQETDLASLLLRKSYRVIQASRQVIGGDAILQQEVLPILARVDKELGKAADIRQVAIVIDIGDLFGLGATGRKNGCRQEKREGYSIHLVSTLR